jgi:hypothetical protein
MSIPDKAAYILYGVAYLALGFWALRGFLIIARSLNKFPKADSNKHIKNSEDA